MPLISPPEFLDLLKTQLEARADLLALTPLPTVYTAWPTIDYSITDAIILGYDARAPRDPESLGRNRLDEQVTLDSQVRVMRSGAGEAKAKICRDRAALIVAAVDNELRTNHPELAGADDHVLWARIGSYTMSQFPDPGGEGGAMRVAVIEFEAIYRARIAP